MLKIDDLPQKKLNKFSRELRKNAQGIWPNSLMKCLRNQSDAQKSKNFDIIKPHEKFVGKKRAVNLNHTSVQYSQCQNDAKSNALFLVKWHLI